MFILYRRWIERPKKEVIRDFIIREVTVGATTGSIIVNSSQAKGLMVGTPAITVSVLGPA